MADQLAPQSLPIYGHPQVKTPNLKRFAEESIVFENAYSNFPLCVPARMSMLSGRYAHNIGVWDNASEMSAATPTISHYLRREGYIASLVGKMHFIGPDQLHGYNERLTTDIYPSNFAWTPDWVKGESFRPTGINMRAVVDAGVCVRSLQIDYDDEVEHSGVQKIYDLARFTKDPFFLTVSFTHPHSPFVTTQKYWDLYDHEQIEMPAVPPIALQDLDEMSRWLHYAHAADKHTITQEHIRTARHAYYGMISYIDDKFGSLIDALTETGLLEDTIVLFTSDHGEMLGERGMWYKQCFFEWSARVPLIVRYPKEFKASRVNNLVSLVDLLPTIMDCASGKEFTGFVSPIDGRSLINLLSGSSLKDENFVVSEYTGEGVIAPCRMVRWDNYKYIYTHGYEPLLYDLKEDPNELNNLSGDQKLLEIERHLFDLSLENWNPEEISQNCIKSQKERLFIQESTGGKPHWAFRFQPNDNERFIRNASAVGTKIKARYPFVEPTPFEK